MPDNGTVIELADEISLKDDDINLLQPLIKQLKQDEANLQQINEALQKLVDNRARLQGKITGVAECVQSIIKSFNNKYDVPTDVNYQLDDNQWILKKVE